MRNSWFEFLVNVAIAYFMLSMFFILPYAYIREFIPMWMMILYFAVGMVYSIFWIKDKWGFFKDEFKG